MQEMKYFNEGNDCDICKNQLMTGRDGTVEDCRRRQNGLSCRFEERDILIFVSYRDMLEKNKGGETI